MCAEVYGCEGAALLQSNLYNGISFCGAVSLYFIGYFRPISNQINNLWRSLDDDDMYDLICTILHIKALEVKKENCRNEKKGRKARGKTFWSAD